MANKIIQIPDSKDEEIPINMEVYRDISMESQLVNVIGFNDGKPTHKQSYQISRDININAIFNSIYNIFSWIQGERILNPEFGTKLRTYLYEGITPMNREAIAAEIKGVCLKYEPRINITNITPIIDVNDQENNTIRLDIKFSIPGLTDDQFTYTYTYTYKI